jgi:hypothetical protein
MRPLFLSVIFAVSSSIFAQNVRVTILHVNDVYQFASADGGTRGGLARLLTLKKQALAENPNTIFTLGGDRIRDVQRRESFNHSRCSAKRLGCFEQAIKNAPDSIIMPKLKSRIVQVIKRFDSLGKNASLWVKML